MEIFLKSAFRRLVAVSAVSGAGAVAYFVGSGRFDYAAHYLAGAGGTLALIAAVNVAWRLLESQWPSAFSDSAPGIMVATLASIGFGLVAEFTVFAAPVADIVDIVHQSLGAIVVGIACIAFQSSHRSWAAVFVTELVAAGVGAVMIAVGAVLVGLI